MDQSVSVFFPMRAGSKRVPKKNTKTFSGIDGGLCRIKLEQRLACELVKKILVSTNDLEVVKISNVFNSKKLRLFLGQTN